MPPSNRLVKSTTFECDENTTPGSPNPIYKFRAPPPGHAPSLGSDAASHNSNNTSPPSSHVSQSPSATPSSPKPQTTPHTQSNPPPPSPLSPTAIKERSKEYESSLTGVTIIDEGEKDSEGHVLEASHERCAECGGMIVWATKGEYLMICGTCGEPQ